MLSFLSASINPSNICLRTKSIKCLFEFLSRNWTNFTLVYAWLLCAPESFCLFIFYVFLKEEDFYHSFQCASGWTIVNTDEPVTRFLYIKKSSLLENFLFFSGRQHESLYICHCEDYTNMDSEYSRHTLPSSAPISNSIFGMVLVHVCICCTD